MNQLDLLILLPLLFFCYRGFVNGFVKEVFGIVGTILAVFLTFQYMDVVGSWIQPLFDPKNSLVPFISAILIFVGTLTLVNILAFVIKKLLEAVQLNFINRLSGLVFGLLKSGIIISALLIILSGFGIPSEESRKSSMLYSYIMPLAPWAYNSVASVYPGAGELSDILDKYRSVESFSL